MGYFRFMKIVEVSIETGFMLLLILTIRYLFRKYLSAKASYALLLILLISLLLPHVPILSTTTSPNIGVNFAHINSYILDTQLQNYNDYEPTSPPPAPIPHDLSPSKFSKILACVYGIWCIGALCYLLYLLYNHLYVYYFCYKHARAQHDYKIKYLLKEICEEISLTKYPQVLITTPNFNPSLFGLIKPKILLPDNYKELFTYDQLKLIFYHECYHLKRRDLHTNMLFNIFHILHWFNPLMWLAMKQIRQQRELSCDEDVLSRIDLKQRINYGNLLIHLSQLNSRYDKNIPSLVAFGGKPKLIKRRILMIKNNKKKMRPLLLISLMASLLVFAVAFAKDNTNYTQVRVDNIDLPFVDDPEVLGNWISVDFVKTPDQFNPDEKYWEGDLYLTNLRFLPNGEVKLLDDTERPYLKWTKGIVTHAGDLTASAYIIKEIDDVRYMFFEWKSGDYTLRGMDPYYYVLRENLN